MLVYQREPHARQMAFEAIPQPTCYAERLALADRTQEDFGLACDVVVDAMDDRSRALFGDQPNSLILVGPDGVVRMKQPWADPDELEAVLPELLPALTQRLARDARGPGATPHQRVALARATHLAADRARARVSLETDARDDPMAAELALLLDIDALETGDTEAPEPLVLAARAREVFRGRPAAESALLAALVPHGTEGARAALLDRIAELAADESRTPDWAAAER